MFYDIADYFGMTANVAVSAQRARSRRGITVRGASDLGGATDAFGFYIDEFNIDT